ncbi:MAG: plasmid mobilization relaxosome protein MobC [Candidatus Saccharibacteria bacterium]|nr:plasmid mobilization relaxosome protein MobC [Candidatus Saccharibacteria bacterium]
MTVISLKLNEDETRRLDDVRLLSGLTRYAFAMSLVRGGISQKIDHRTILAKEPIGDFKMVETNITMPDFIKKAVVLRSKAIGMKTSPYIAAVLQAQTLRKPMLRHNELQALVMSQRELSAIGRNLNQIARALNDKFTESDRLKLELLLELKAKIEIQKDAISAVLRASLRSWGVDE